MSSNPEVLVPDVTDVLVMTRRPEHVIRQAMEAGDALKAAVQKNGWAVNLGGRNPHVMIEGAEFLGWLFNISARVVPGSSTYIELGDARGWQAEAETMSTKTGMTLTRASSMCLDNEDNWSLRQKYEGRAGERRKATDAAGNLIMVATPQFQLRSMAETRACSKAFRLLFGWIYTANGFASTGAEEMDGGGNQRPIRPPQARATTGNKVTEAQVKRLWAVAYDKKKSNEEIIAVIKHFGFESSNDITRDKYDEIVAELLKSDASE